jgi:hypothetical protein
MTREPFCDKVKESNEKSMKCHMRSPDTIIEIDFSLGEFCRYLKKYKQMARGFKRGTS